MRQPTAATANDSPGLDDTFQIGTDPDCDAIRRLALGDRVRAGEEGKKAKKKEGKEHYSVRKSLKTD